MSLALPSSLESACRKSQMVLILDCFRDRLDIASMMALRGCCCGSPLHTDTIYLFEFFCSCSMMLHDVLCKRCLRCDSSRGGVCCVFCLVFFL